MTPGSALERAAARGLLAVTAVAWLLGCAQIAGTNDYQVATEAETTRVPEPLPAPFLTGSDECEACATDTCGAQLAACEADDVCAEWLADLRARQEPLAAYERDQLETSLAWEYWHVLAQPSYKALYELKECAETCLDVCPVGQNFACVGSFDWDIPQPTVLRTRAVTNSRGVAAEVRACAETDHCGAPLSSSQTDELGFAELRFESTSSQRARVNYYRVLKEAGSPWQYAQTRPLGENDYTPIHLVDDARLHDWIEGFGEEVDSERGILVAIPLDCSGENAKHVSLEVWSYVDGDLTLCADCAYAYAANTDESPSRELDGYLTAGHAGYIANVPKGVVYVVVRRMAEPAYVVSVAKVWVEAGEVGTVRLFPASAEELALFPRK